MLKSILCASAATTLAICATSAKADQNVGAFNAQLKCKDGTSFGYNTGNAASGVQAISKCNAGHGGPDNKPVLVRPDASSNVQIDPRAPGMMATENSGGEGEELTAPGRPPRPPVPLGPYLPSWEIAGQFNPTNSINAATNPFEVWTYGYTANPDCSGPVVPFRFKKYAGDIAGRAAALWSMGPNPDSNTGDLPMVSQSEGATQLSPLRYSPQGLAMHPGPANQCAVVRFTAPAAGKYHIVGRFWAENITAGGTNTLTSLSFNGGPPVNALSVTAPSGPAQSNPFDVVRQLQAGNTIDFRVGANGSFYNDTTGLNGYIQLN